MAHKIKLKQEFEEFEIGDKVYRMYLSDQKIKDFMKGFEDLSKVALSVEKDKESIEQASGLAKELFNLLFGEKTGEEIYELCGNSTYVIMDVFRQIIPVVHAKIDDMKDLEVKKYTE
ncbi:MAG: hypothetical protein JJU16_05165 [Alkalibacterium sp.]|nr:hypothetical protein [Alkalibacterium sp.]